MFGRLGWSDGRNEAYEYTEVDRTVRAGRFLERRSLEAPNDRTGARLRRKRNR